MYGRNTMEARMPKKNPPTVLVDKGNVNSITRNSLDHCAVRVVQHWRVAGVAMGAVGKEEGRGAAARA